MLPTPLLPFIVWAVVTVLGDGIHCYHVQHVMTCLLTHWVVQVAHCWGSLGILVICHSCIRLWKAFVIFTACFIYATLSSELCDLGSPAMVCSLPVETSCLPVIVPAWLLVLPWHGGFQMASIVWTAFFLILCRCCCSCLTRWHWSCAPTALCAHIAVWTSSKAQPCASMLDLLMVTLPTALTSVASQVVINALQQIILGMCTCWSMPTWSPSSALTVHTRVVSRVHLITTWSPSIQEFPEECSVT